MKKKSEHDLLEEYLKNELDKHNIFNFHGNPTNLKGFPDRIIMTNEIIAVELKLGKENNSYYGQTPMQKKWEKQFTQAGITYLLISTREEIDVFVKKVYENCREHQVLNHFSYNKNIE